MQQDDRVQITPQDWRAFLRGKCGTIKRIEGQDVHVEMEEDGREVKCMPSNLRVTATGEEKQYGQLKKGHCYCCDEPLRWNGLLLDPIPSWKQHLCRVQFAADQQCAECLKCPVHCICNKEQRRHNG